ncbi:MAG TPA: FAD-binding oxidoreductase [Gaiellaceae bacterium]|nr:FAD-binding oxidoreductase [Gaiellaceae bacterium]
MAIPWWLEDAPPDEAAPPLARDLDADVAIVGGGYCGLWTALALHRRSPELRVVLLEAARCGHGPSGRNGGFLHGYWSMLGWLREVLGDKRALELARAGDRILPAVRELGEDVWLREAGLLEVATTDEQEASLGHAVETACELGVPDEAVAVSAEEVERRCASPRFRSGVLFRECATVQPARLARALRRAALAAGVELYEHSPAERVRDNRVKTPDGSVRARDVVLATNAALASWGPTAPRLARFRSHVVLTEPVPDLLRELGWTGGEAISDGRMFIHYFRTTEDGRVLMGSAGGTRRHAERGLRLLLPALADAKITHDWGGPIDVSADRLPQVGSHGRIHYAAGFAGNGVGPTWLAAQALSSLVLRANDEWSRLPLVGRYVPRLPPFKYAGGELVRRSILALEEAEEEGRRRPLFARAGAALPRLTGTRLGLR